METTYKTSTLSNGLLWFGAAISIAEIFTGTLFVPLGFAKGFLAIILGHLIGCILLYYAGVIGAESHKSSMESVGFSFGSKGKTFFAVLNVLQLVGWTAVMIIQGARAIGILLNTNIGIQSDLLWCVIIGISILIWVAIGTKTLEKVNVIAIGGLFLLTLLLCYTVFQRTVLSTVSSDMSFGAAIELSIAMPLSWLPLISDYTKDAENSKVATKVSVLTYFAGSVFMYAIGLGAALFTGESDIASVMLNAGFGVFGIFIILLSTVTTTFLDVYSAGVSLKTIDDRLSENKMAMLVCIIGTMLAILTPVEQYENFLYLIGSVFAPMISILIADYFILKKKEISKTVDVKNFIIWAIGFGIYRIFLNVDTVIGSTFPVMIVTFAICIAANKIKRNFIR
jgi:putative hydroxymethylpyrimidine transporter CytX